MFITISPTSLSLNINKIVKVTFLISSLLLTVNLASAQILNQSGINIGVKMGSARLITEYSENNSINEFSNRSGFAAGFEISKVLFPHIELGIELSNSVLNGKTDKTDHFSAIGFHAALREPLEGPTEYINKLVGEKLFIRYYINEAFKKSKINPFVKVGFGYLSYKSTFQYIESQEIIFGKGEENQTNLSTGMLTTGTGFKTKLSKQAYFITSIDFNFVKYDFLDVVHNYDNEGKRKNVTGLYTVISAGIYFNSAKSEINSSSKKKKRNGSGDTDYLPFGR